MTFFELLIVLCGIAVCLIVIGYIIMAAIEE